jgi:hypothetical protein
MQPKNLASKENGGHPLSNPIQREKRSRAPSVGLHAAHSLCELRGPPTAKSNQPSQKRGGAPPFGPSLIISGYRNKEKGKKGKHHA